MPKVMIKGIEMPKRCKGCPMNKLSRWTVKPYCVVTGEFIKNENRKPKNCPLQEVKE